MTVPPSPFAPLAGMSGAVASVITSRKTLLAQNVTAERAKWRDKLRTAIEQAFTSRNRAGWRALWLTLNVNTNPFDPEDRLIVSRVRQLATAGRNPALEDELIDRLALLLRHDWDRAKYEAGDDVLPARRMAYDDYVQWVSSGMPRRPYWSLQRPMH